jgi:hypothetical protein
MPIPNVTPAPAPKVVALMPPTARYLKSEPTPIPPPTPAVIPVPQQRPPSTPVAVPVPARIPLPPPEYDRPYKGDLTILKPGDYALVRAVCSDNVDPIACAFRTFDRATGETIACVIILGPKAHNDPRALLHELGHCNSWPSDHPGARYD